MRSFHAIVASSFVKMEYTLFEFEVCTYQDIIKKILFRPSCDLFIYLRTPQLVEMLIASFPV